MKDKKVCVVGLGYVGLPLAQAFSRHLNVIGFDIDAEKLKNLTEDINNENLLFTSDPTRIQEADSS